MLPSAGAPDICILVPKFRVPKIDDDEPRESHPLLFPAFWLIVFLGAITASGPWAGTRGLLFSLTGIVMILFPPNVRLPKAWLLLGAAFLVLGAASFLPVAWIGMPEWRQTLEGLGFRTGPLVAVQPELAMESYLQYAALFIPCLWLLGHRVPPAQLRLVAILFVSGVAVFAVASKLAGSINGWGTFGFFPNRNHSGAYLAMGAVCGLGLAFQYAREREFTRLALMLACTGLCFWALVFWSISRGPVLLAALGTVVWIFMMGPAYLGVNGRRFVLLAVGLVTGIFLLSENTVKTRLTASTSKITTMADETGREITPEDIDARIPIALDTATMISHNALTGVGPGQYAYVFPQFRKNAALAHDFQILHPESDWLWIASEMGVPAFLALGALATLVVLKSARAVRGGRVRATRAALFSAAVILVLHGFIDVPGHHLPLLFAAVLLGTMSLSEAHDPSPGAVYRWIFRGLGCAVLAWGGFLLLSEAKNDDSLALTLQSKTMEKADSLVRRDTVLPEYQEGTPNPVTDAITLLQKASHKIPLSLDFQSAISRLAANYEELDPVMFRAMKAERDLYPTSIDLPFRQALLLRTLELYPEAVSAWGESLSRSRKIAGNQPLSPWAPARIEARIRKESEKPKELKEAAAALLPAEKSAPPKD